MGWCLSGIDPKKREEWQFQMEAPLPWETATAPGPADAENDLAAFNAAIAALTN